MGLYRDHGKEHGNYYLGFRVQGLKLGILGLYRDHGKENGDYYLGFRVQGLKWFRDTGLHRDSGTENGNYYLGCPVRSRFVQLARELLILHEKANDWLSLREHSGTYV